MTQQVNCSDSYFSSVSGDLTVKKTKNCCVIFNFTTSVKPDWTEGADEFPVTAARIGTPSGTEITFTDLF